MLSEARSLPCFQLVFDVATFESSIGSVKLDLELSPSPSPPLSSHGVVVALLPSPPMASLSFASSISLSNLPLPLRTHHHPPPTPTAPTLFAAAAYGAKPYKGSVKRLWSPRGKKSAKRKRKKKQQLRLSKMVGPLSDPSCVV
uniref:Uncharacterized protein n=1 Tax=Ananas comosus var. bracteatus TaxID=296719 RepID=A0A6V7PM15_ANACO|nr:unnamed protein product [Ananas comosus var. bracteatus]